MYKPHLPNRAVALFRTLLLLLALPAAFSSSAQSLRNGALWPDDRGQHINAHGGGILLHQGTYYWFGEHKAEHTSSAQVGDPSSSSADPIPSTPPPSLSPSFLRDTRPPLKPRAG